MSLISINFTGIKGIDFDVIQSYPPIILSKTDQFSVDGFKDKVLLRRLKFKIGSTIKGIDTKLPDGSTDVKLSWEPGNLISTEDFGDGFEFNFGPIRP